MNVEGRKLWSLKEKDEYERMRLKEGWVNMEYKKKLYMCQAKNWCAKLCRMTKKPQQWTLVKKLSWGIEVISLGLSFLSYIVDFAVNFGFVDFFC